MKIVKIIFRITAAFLLLLLFIATVSFLYVYINKDVIVSRITTSLNEELDGKISIADVDFSFFKYFPATSVNLKNLSVKDSLFDSHKIEFLKAGNVFIKINLTDLFATHINLEKITIENGSLYFFTDSLGYSNGYLVKGKKKKSTAPGKESFFSTGIQKINLNRMQLTYRDYMKKKFMSVYMQELDCEIKNSDELTKFHIKSSGLTRFLSFNTEKGMYARNATFKNNFDAEFDLVKREFSILPSAFIFNKKPYNLSAKFTMGEVPYFTMDIGSTQLDFKQAISLLPKRANKILSKFDFSFPVNVNVHVEGAMAYRVVPAITVNLVTTDNTFLYQENEFKQCSMSASFVNNADTTLKNTDENSLIHVKKFKAAWEGLPLTSLGMKISNLKKPFIKGDIHSVFPLSAISKLSGSSLYNFSTGNGKIDIVAQAQPDSSGYNANIHGRLVITNGAVLYGPRSMPFNNINADVIFSNRDVIIKELNCKTGSSNLSLKGEARKLLAIVDQDPGESNLKWTISSTSVDMADLTPFLGGRKSVAKAPTKSKAKLAAAESRLDQYLENCSLDMLLNVDEVKFKNFRASRVSGNVKLVNEEWFINSVNFNHAGGFIAMNAKLKEISPEMQSVNFNAKLKNVDISRLFVSFDNFAQKSVTSKNIDGKLDATAVLSFNMNSKTQIQQSSLRGEVELTLSDGEVKGFQPLGKLSKTIFRKRDFTEIKFSDLNNSFTVNGNKIFFNRMKINSSVLELYIEGSYHLDGTTDLDIQVPLKNLKNRNWDDLADDIHDKGEKGVNIYIHAETDDKGELHFRYNPLKKILNRREQK